MGKYEVPCKGCDERTVHCHSKCEEYLEYVKHNKQRKQAERSEKVYVSNGWGYIPRKKRKK